ncbi:hypothetical protein BS47DRAFT_376697 [Hydnum rufescens UP504]|uniref:Uncharacterized protein n=1 Tax=Hydnum rufescens UP504 TaxID=1448309 RepID=A0A9P6B6D3_9AGAM|nr:hypothetical protein BS47DRAFT_376697 [Hydnum rufescens UP504]
MRARLQLVNTSNTCGGGKYNPQVAAQLRWIRTQYSIARNPSFQFLNPRIDTCICRVRLPHQFFVSGHLDTTNLDLDVARGFYQYGRFLPGFYRREGAFGILGNAGLAGDIWFRRIRSPEGVGNYGLSPEDLGLHAGVRYSCSHCGLVVCTRLVCSYIFPQPYAKYIRNM